jgi:RNA polymerase sigma-70 factor, ECF subfamily
MKNRKRMIGWLYKKVHIFEQLSEHRLLAKIQQGDKEAFGQLYLHYLDNIYKYIFFRVDQDKAVAEDLTQTVFFKAWQKIDSFATGKGTFRAWLYRIAHNSVIDYYKITKPVGRVENYIADKETIELLEECVDRKTRIENVMQAVNKLTDEQKAVIIMKFINEFSNEEIAMIIQKDETAVRALQYRGLKRLRNMLKKHE